MASRAEKLNFWGLTIFLVFVSFILIGMVVIGGWGKIKLREAHETQYANIAKHTAATMDAYVTRIAYDVAILARMPAVQSIVREGNLKPYIPEEVKGFEQQWNATRTVPSGLSPSPLQNDAARIFASIVRPAHPVYQEILLTDKHGRLVAASGATSNYDQSCEAWWRQFFDPPATSKCNPPVLPRAGCTPEMEKLGCPNIDDVKQDDSVGLYGMGVAVPVREKGKVIGVLKVVVGPNEMLALLNAIQLGGTAKVVILKKDNGIMVPLPNNQPFFAAKEIPQASGERFVHLQASTPKGKKMQIVVALNAMPSTGLDWKAVVYQSDKELFAPLYAQLWALVLLVATLAVTIWALGTGFYVSRMLAMSRGERPAGAPTVEAETSDNALTRPSI